MVAQKRFFSQGFILGLAAVYALQFCAWLIHSDQPLWQDLWMSRDQQGQYYFERGDYKLAAQRFIDRNWKAAALYADGQFEPAEILWSRQSGARALFNQGNALAHQKRYRQAADNFWLALQQRPDWSAAQHNLELVRALAEEPEAVTDFSGDTVAQLEADQVVFDRADSERMQQATETQQQERHDMSSQEIQALWMRRLQSTPSDFLRLKFYYQTQSEPSR
ncbi:hypothetical protein HBA55_24930 [Pseudomaricurvus alkylphenolicus]|uniref:tetratricopeptide repeat protein n=1 Tax=Pseudomaricurvus alkylphenolicus TaxID=1306991 RepID=UPI0014205C42|nr:tetratricopeptide repeat protein [Pseudomaricurvus alkylphenolicus]NIB42875.1 hypothetical protein [Pseudomaricurvus alkylphenolicus]